MNVALKEWAVMVEGLSSGHQIAILRKGGIVEAARTGFEVRHRQFLLYPTFEHQHAASLRPEFTQWLRPVGEMVPVTMMADVTDVVQAPPKLELLLQPEFIWNRAFLELRYNYRPDLPLWLLVLRVHHLRPAVQIPDRPSYAGCKSWVNLTEEIDVGDVRPVLDGEEFALRRTTLLDRLK